MGCDIHMWAEVKRTYANTKVKPEWEAVGNIFPSPYYHKDEVSTIRAYKNEDGQWESYSDNEKLTNEPYVGRNYSLFSILANVRNGYGFAGVDTGDGFKPLAEPRGVPKDASTFFQKEVEAWGVDGHSHSYITLKELENFDWKGQTTTRRGMVTPKEYKKWLKHKGRPNEWCGGTTAEDYKKIEWKETYYECVKDFVDKTIPRLQKLRNLKYVQDVRIVFFFDN